MGPRAILVVAFVAFLIYAFPGFLGWDSEASLVQARSGHYSDAHPPIIALLWRLTEVFVAGPLGMLLIQAATLLVGLYLIFVRELRPKPAALAAAAVFLFPPVSGVTGLIDKDALMAGFVVLGIGLGLHKRMKLAMVALVLGTAMRWNALAATLAPVLWLVDVGGATTVRRYARAAAAWVAITIAALAINTAITDRREYAWYGSHAYQDIAGTLHYVTELDDAQLAALLEGVPLLATDHLRSKLDALYDPAEYRQLQKYDGRIFEIPADAVQRAAIVRVWKATVLGHPSAYLHYRWDNFRKLVRIDPMESYSQVYVWFHVIANDDSIAILDHDAGPSTIQARLRGWAISVSRTPLYDPYIYLLIALLLLLLFMRDRLARTLLLAGLTYEAAWFVLDPTADFRYSQWLILMTVIAGTLRLVRCNVRVSTDNVTRALQ
ncbi:MAG TPA: hypothetical protein VGG28_17705 [Kofleriaceae bacterium]